VIVCLVDDGHVHDIEVVLMSLRQDPTVLTTIVVEQFHEEYPTPALEVPEGYDAQVFFDRRRAWHRRVHLFPAIDPLATISRTYPTDEHAEIAQRCRQLLSRYNKLDPELVLTEAVDLRPELRAAPRLIRYLGQHLRMEEPFTSAPAERTGPVELAAQVEELLSA
jgi:F0F1-type ATP synthase beta subunit